MENKDQELLERCRAERQYLESDEYKEFQAKQKQYGRKGNLGNSYERVLSGEFLEKCPKSVLAALAVSLASLQVNEDFEKIESFLYNEWRLLNENGIVPQKPYKKRK